MGATSVVETLAGDWDTNWGDAEEDREWRRLFWAWIRTTYPDAHLGIVGNEIHGPAAYVYPELDTGWDRDELPDLPDSIYDKFVEDLEHRIGSEYEALMYWMENEKLPPSP